MNAIDVALIAGAYLCGSIPFGFLLAKRKGVDVRAVGSGNIGATNVARSIGKRTGLLVLALDAVKGAVPVGLARYLVSEGQIDVWVLAATALAAIVGHCFPVWLGFRGGKGVATSLGVFLVIDPGLAGLGVLLFAATYAAFRIASLGSVTATIAFPILLWAFERPDELVQLGIAGAALIVFKHRGNLQRIFQGREHKV